MKQFARLTCDEVFRTFIGGPPFALSGPLMQADLNEGMCKGLQVEEGRFITSCSLSNQFSRVTVWRCYIWCIDQLWQIKF